MSEKEKKKKKGKDGGGFKGFWDSTKKSVKEFFSDEKIIEKAMDIYADDVKSSANIHGPSICAEDVKTKALYEKTIGQTIGSYGNSILGKPVVPTSGIAVLAGHRYLFDDKNSCASETIRDIDLTSSTLRLELDLAHIPDSFRKHMAWEKSLRPGMLGRPTKAFEITTPTWQREGSSRSTFGVTYRLNTGMGVTGKSIKVLKGDILMFVGFLSDLETFTEAGNGAGSKMLLPLTAQQWIINEKTVDFSFTEDEVEMITNNKDKQ